MSATKILLLEDDPNLGFIVQENLELRGFEVTKRLNGADGLAAFRAERFDLCLVDVMMPKKDGFSFAREVRAVDQQTPLIFLTAKTMKEDKIEGFEIGADDYVTKPFSMEELLLRIQAVLKRSGGRRTDAATPVFFTIGTYQFDYEHQTIRIKSKTHKLTTKEADLLRLLCLHKNETLSREEALTSIWGDDSYFNGRSMDVFISRLRAILKNDPSVEIINVHGVGYKLLAGK